MIFFIFTDVFFFINPNIHTTHLKQWQHKNETWVKIERYYITVGLTFGFCVWLLAYLRQNALATTHVLAISHT